MKPLLLVVLLVASLAVNAALYFNQIPTAAPAATSGGTSSRLGESGHDSPAPRKTAARDALASATRAATWAELQSGDAATFRERLRLAGFPSAAIRALLSAEVYEKFSDRRKALLSQHTEIPFWKTSSRGFDPKLRAELRELNRQQSEEMKALLGREYGAINDEARVYRRREFGDLPDDKLEQLSRITGDYADLRSEIYGSANGLILPEDREKLTLLEREQRADLASVMTPQELENYELRSSNTANQLRSQLTVFQPTEEEFRSLFRLQRAFEEKNATTTIGMNLAQQRQFQEELSAQAQSVLSADRLEAYKQAIDPALGMINRLVTRLDLPATAASQVVATQKDMQSRANTLRSDTTLTPEQRNTQLAALAQEATTKLTTALGGSRGLEAYKQYGGQWLQNLQPRPATPGR